ncbi:MAG: MFS transporter [Flaviflexus sp.]|uniref:MFS transporter n=1 Tax=Flaviflexus sp. TaxID=1969482 RepID=UPI003F8E02DF
MSSPLRALAAPIYIPSLIYSIGNGALQPVIVLAALDIGFGEAGSSAVLGVAGVIGVFTAPLLGKFITRVGDRRSLIIASLLALAALAVSTTALFFPGTFFAKAAFLLGIAIIAISLNVWTLARQAYIADALPGIWRGRGLSTLGGMLRLGVLVGPLISTALIALWGLESVFVMNAVTVAISLALIVRYLVPLPKPAEASQGEDGSAPAADADQGEPSSAQSGTAKIARTEAKESAGAGGTSHKRYLPTDAHPGGVPRPDLKATVIAGIGITSLTILRANKNVIIPLWGTALGLDNELITLAFAVSALIDTVLFYPAGKLADRKGRLWALMPSLTIMSAAIILMVSWGTVPGFFIGAALLGFGNGFGSGILMTLGADLSPSTKRATFLGYWQAIANSGSATGPFVVSGLTAALGISAGLWATAGLGLFGAVWFRLLLPKTYARLGLNLHGMPIQSRDFDR